MYEANRFELKRTDIGVFSQGVLRLGRLLLLFLTAFFVFRGLLWVYDTVLERGPAGLLSAVFPTREGASFHLKEQPVYHIKNRQELLGVRVFRIVSRYQPEEFLILDGISRHAVQQVYGKPVDSFWANQIANQLLKLRGNGDSAAIPPVSVEIQKIHTIQSGHVAHAKRQWPYWQLEIKFKLSNENNPRYYEAGIVRLSSNPDASALFSSDKDTLIVGYAPREAYQKELVSDLMRQMDFSGEG